MVDKTKPALSANSRRRRGNISLGHTVRELRKNAALTLVELSQAAGLSISTLSKVENDQISPTYDTILALASGLQVDLTELLTGRPAPMVSGRKAVTRKGEGLVHETLQYTYEVLCSGIAHRQFIPLLTTINARSVQSFDQLIEHPGEEFVYVMDGEVELHTSMYEPTLLQAGDSCYFDSTMGHVLVNAGDDPATILWVCSQVVGELAQKRG